MAMVQAGESDMVSIEAGQARTDGRRGCAS